MTLELSNVSITLGGRQLVKDVDLALSPGEVVGLLGPNGAGKTTTFNLVIGLLCPDQGEVVIDGRRVTDLPMPQRARLGVGYLPQEASVFRNLTVRENLDIALEQTDLSPERRRDRRQQLIEDFHLTAFMNRRGFQLSGGERRRCEVARALASGVNGPLYLLLAGQRFGNAIMLLSFAPHCSLDFRVFRNDAPLPSDFPYTFFGVHELINPQALSRRAE